jgi:hypothetical protein
VYIAINSSIALWLTMMQDQKSLTLSWLSFSWSGRECIAFFVAYKRGQYIQYTSKWPSLQLITWFIRPKIVDTPLALILL